MWKPCDIAAGTCWFDVPGIGKFDDRVSCSITNAAAPKTRFPPMESVSLAKCHSQNAIGGWPYAQVTARSTWQWDARTHKVTSVEQPSKCLHLVHEGADGRGAVRVWPCQDVEKDQWGSHN